MKDHNDQKGRRGHKKDIWKTIYVFRQEGYNINQEKYSVHFVIE